MKEVLQLRDTFIEQEGEMKFDENVNLTTEYNDEKSLSGVSYLGAQQKNEKLNEGLKKPRNLGDDDDVKLFDRYTEREIKGNQMECSLSMKNYGIRYIQQSFAAVLKIQFRSNCFKHSSQVMLVVQNVVKYPPSQAILHLPVGIIKLQFKGIKNDGMFDVHNTQYKIIPDGLPKTTKKQERSLKQNDQENEKIKDEKNEDKIDRQLVNESRVKQYQQKSQERGLMKASGVQYDIIQGTQDRFFFPQVVLKQLWDGQSVISCGYTKEQNTFAYYYMTCHF